MQYCIQSTCKEPGTCKYLMLVVITTVTIELEEKRISPALATPAVIIPKRVCR